MSGHRTGTRWTRTALRLAVLTVTAVLAVGVAIVQGREALPPPAPVADGAGAARGVTWASGAGTSDREGFARFRNRPVAVGVTWNDADTWADMRQLWTLADYTDDRPQRLSFAQPLLAEGDTLASCAAGEHDADLRAIARGLATRGFPDAYVRLGWEFNGTDYRWQAGDDHAGFIACFRRAAGVFRSVSPAFAIEWTVQATATDSPADRSYPGDDVVDVIGADFYDGWPSATSPAAFRTKCEAREGSNPVGLCAWADFARAHGKPLAVPEWGIRNQPGPGGGGDNAVFVASMFEFFRAHADQLAYEAYFDLQGQRFELSGGENPRAAAVYRGMWSR